MAKKPTGKRPPPSKQRKVAPSPEESVPAKRKAKTKGEDKLCPRCLEHRPIMAERRVCNRCHSHIAKGGDRRIAEGLSPLGFWDLDPTDRRRIWKVWVRCLVDQLTAPVSAMLMSVPFEVVKRWYTVGDADPQGELVQPMLNAIIYLNTLTSQRMPYGEDTHPSRLKPVKLELSLLQGLFAKA